MTGISRKWAGAAFFLIDGTGFGFWAAHIPVVQRNLQLDTAALSYVLLCIVLGSIVSMPLTGYLIARYGSRSMVRGSAVFYVVTIVMLAQMGTHWGLLVAAVLFGSAKGSLDVSINAQAVAVERLEGRPCMSLCQGNWSLGALLGSGVSSVLLGHGGTARVDLMLCAGLLTVLGLAAFQSLVEDPVATGSGARLTWPNGYLLRLALLAFFGLFAEGAVGDWAAVYLHLDVGASLAWAAAGYSAYAIAMAAARFAGGWVAEHVPDRVLLSASGLLAAAGFATLLLAKAWPLGFIGLALTGVGVANVVPVVMNAAGRSTKTATGNAISIVSTFGYFGFLAGPPLIGWVAHRTSLNLSLWLVVVAGLMVAAGPRFARLAE